MASSAENVRLAQSYPGVAAAVGIHPWNAVSPTGEVKTLLRELARQESVTIIGEVGLDYVRTPESKKTQKELFKYELSLSQETGLPLNIHCRGADSDMIELLRQEVGTSVRGIMHGFTGDQTALEKWLALGLHISIGNRGFLTDEQPALPEAVRKIPRERLLTETDTTGQSGSLTDIIAVVEKLASLRGTTAEDISDTATANLKRLLQR